MTRKDKIRAIVKVLEEFEDMLSDGYNYYVGEARVRSTLSRIAEEILEAID